MGDPVSLLNPPGPNPLSGLVSGDPDKAGGKGRPSGPTFCGQVKPGAFYPAQQSDPKKIKTVELDRSKENSWSARVEEYTDGSVTKIAMSVVDLLTQLPFLTEFLFYTVSGPAVLVDSYSTPDKIRISVDPAGIQKINTGSFLGISWNETCRIDAKRFKNADAVRSALADLRHAEGELASATEPGKDGKPQPKFAYDDRVAQVCNQIRRELQNLLFQFEAAEHPGSCFDQSLSWQGQAGGAVPEGIPAGITNLQMNFRAYGSHVQLVAQEDFGATIGYAFDLDKKDLDPRLAVECLALIKRYEALGAASGKSDPALQAKLDEVRAYAEQHLIYTYSRTHQTNEGWSGNTFSDHSITLAGNEKTVIFFANDSRTPEMELDLSQPNLDPKALDKAFSLLEGWKALGAMVPGSDEEVTYKRVRDALLRRIQNKPIPSDEIVFAPISKDSGAISLRTAISSVNQPAANPFAIFLKQIGAFYSTKLEAHFEGNIFSLRCNHGKAVTINVADPFVTQGELNDAREQITQMMATVQEQRETSNLGDLELLSRLLKEIEHWERSGARLLYYQVPFGQGPGASQLFESQRGQSPSSIATAVDPADQLRLQPKLGGKTATQTPVTPQPKAIRNEPPALASADELAFLRSVIDQDQNNQIDLAELNVTSLVEIFLIKNASEHGDQAKQDLYIQLRGRMTPQAIAAFDLIDANNNPDGREPDRLTTAADLQITMLRSQAGFNAKYYALRDQYGADFVRAVDPFFTPSSFPDYHGSEIARGRMPARENLPAKLAPLVRPQPSPVGLPAPVPPAAPTPKAIPAAPPKAGDNLSDPSAEELLFTTPDVRSGRLEAKPAFLESDGKIYSSYDWDTRKYEDATPDERGYLSLVNQRELRINYWHNGSFLGIGNGPQDEIVLDLDCPFPWTEADEEQAQLASKRYGDWKSITRRKGAPVLASPRSEEAKALEKIEKGVANYAVNRPREFLDAEALGQFVIRRDDQTLYVKRDLSGVIEAIRGFEDSACQKPTFTFYLKGRFVNPQDRARALALVEQLSKAQPDGREAAILNAVNQAVRSAFQWEERDDLEHHQAFRTRTVQQGDDAMRLEIGYEQQGGRSVTNLRIIRWDGKTTLFNDHQIADFHVALGRDVLSKEEKENLRDLLGHWKQMVLAENKKNDVSDKNLRAYVDNLGDDASVLRQDLAAYLELTEKLQLVSAGGILPETGFLYDARAQAGEIGRLAEVLRTNDGLTAAQFSLAQARLLLTYGSSADQSEWVKEGVLACERARAGLEEIRQISGEMQIQTQPDYLRVLFYQGVFYALAGDVDQSAQTLAALRSVDKAGVYGDQAETALASQQLHLLLEGVLKDSKTHTRVAVRPSEIVPIYLQYLATNRLDEMGILARDVILGDYALHDNPFPDNESPSMWTSISKTLSDVARRMGVKASDQTVTLFSNNDIGFGRDAYLRKQYFAPETMGLRILTDFTGAAARAKQSLSGADREALEVCSDACLLRVVADLNARVRQSNPQMDLTGTIDELTRVRAQDEKGNPLNLVDEAVTALGRYEDRFYEQGIGATLQARVFASEHISQMRSLAVDLKKGTYARGAMDQYPDRSTSQLLAQRFAARNIPLAEQNRGYELFRDGEWFFRNADAPFGAGIVTDEERWRYVAEKHTLETNGILREIGIESPYYNDEDILSTEVSDIIGTFLKQGGSALDKSYAIFSAFCGDGTDDRRLFKVYQMLMLLEKNNQSLGTPQFYLRYDKGAVSPKLSLGIWQKDANPPGFYSLSECSETSTLKPLSPREAMSQYFTARADRTLAQGNAAESRREYRLAREIDPRNTEAMHGLTKAFVQDGKLEDGISEITRIINQADHPRLELGLAVRKEARAMRAVLLYEANNANGAAEELLTAMSLDSTPDPRLEGFLSQVTRGDKAQGLARLSRGVVQAQARYDDGLSDEAFLALAQKTYEEAFRRINANQQGLADYSLGEHQWLVMREVIAALIKNYREISPDSSSRVNFPQKFELRPSAYYGLTDREKLLIRRFLPLLGWTPVFCPRALKVDGHEEGRTSLANDVVLSIQMNPPGVINGNGIYLEDLFYTDWVSASQDADSLETLAHWAPGKDLDNAMSFMLLSDGSQDSWQRALEIDAKDQSGDNFLVLTRAVEKINAIMADTTEETDKRAKLDNLVADLHKGFWLLDKTYTGIPAGDYSERLIGDLDEAQSKFYGGYPTVAIRDRLNAIDHTALDRSYMPNGVRGNWQQGREFLKNAEQTRDPLAKSQSFGRALFCYASAWAAYGNRTLTESNAERYLKDFDSRAPDSTGQRGALAGPLAAELARVAKESGKYEVALKFYRIALENVLPVATNGGEITDLAHGIFLDLGDLLSGYLSGAVQLSNEALQEAYAVEQLLLSTKGPNFVRELTAFKQRSQSINVGIQTGLTSLAHLSYQAAAYLDPADNDARLGMAFVLRKMERREETQRYLEQLLSTEGLLAATERANVLIQLAGLEAEAGSLTAASDHYFEALQLGSEADRGLALERYLAVYRKMAESDPVYYESCFVNLAKLPDSVFTPEMKKSVHFAQGLHGLKAGNQDLSQLAKSFGWVITESSKSVFGLFEKLLPEIKKQGAAGDGQAQALADNITKIQELLNRAQNNPAAVFDDLPALAAYVEELHRQSGSSLDIAARVEPELKRLEEAFFYAGQAYEGAGDYQRAADLYRLALQAQNQVATGLLTGETFLVQELDQVKRDQAVNPTELLGQIFDLPRQTLPTDDAFNAFREKAMALAQGLCKAGRYDEARKIAMILAELKIYDHVEILATLTDISIAQAKAQSRPEVLEDALKMLDRKIREINQLLNLKPGYGVPPEYVSTLFKLEGRIYEALGRPVQADQAADLAFKHSYLPSQSTVYQAMTAYVEFTLANYLFKRSYMDSDLKEKTAEKIVSTFQDQFVGQLSNLYKMGWQATAESDGVQEWQQARLNQFRETINRLEYAKAAKVDYTSHNRQNINDQSDEAKAIREIGLDPNQLRSLFNDDTGALAKASQDDKYFFDKVTLLMLWSFDRMVEAMAEGNGDRVQAYRLEIESSKRLLRKYGDTFVLSVIGMMEESLDYLTPERVEAILTRLDTEVRTTIEKEEE